MPNTSHERRAEAAGAAFTTSDSFDERPRTTAAALVNTPDPGSLVALPPIRLVLRL